mmetsp:Transcript_9199/g.22595  ORF Transcript_9199/g.22595 Transcript_9199/m.22595 type:complete len:281 (+) Transcript_9199:315-1157(+)|eukprot:CAMPEP_0114491108 /NCGR_PEP_ID=MMETSP0109-20121206/2819_1 /TAXON_ID=29199 /ORGANISM="Chlorarachnion reptans, Strain CCCM449" /LENGTH=280 /DNA_ID=CAMNT_0001667809 /DNA_START=203 /DNA_END=1045 /DNA_ORIENTATION=-
METHLHNRAFTEGAATSLKIRKLAGFVRWASMGVMLIMPLLVYIHYRDLKARQISARIMAVAKAGCSGHVIIVRHGEKESDPVHLSSAGYRRAEYLSQFFSNYDPPIGRLYASNAKVAPYVEREIETLQPLSEAVQVPIITKYPKTDGTRLATNVFQSLGFNCNKSILISWDHCTIPRLAHSLGCKEEACMECWSDKDFDSYLQLSYNCRSSGSGGLSDGCEWVLANATKLKEGFFQLGGGGWGVASDVVTESKLAAYTCQAMVTEVSVDDLQQAYCAPR